MKKLFKDHTPEKPGCVSIETALEELEIERLIREDEEAAKSGFDELKNDKEDAIAQQKENEQEQIETSSNKDSEPGERISGDSELSKEPEVESDNELIADVADEKPTEGISTEHLREILSNFTSHTLHYQTTAFESFGQMPDSVNTDVNDYGQFQDGPKQHSGSNFAKFAKETGKWLGQLGIKLTTDVLPKVLSNVYKGTVYAFNRLAYSFILGFTALEKYITRRHNSFAKLKTEISKSKQVVSILQKEKIEGESTYTDENCIRQLVIGDSVDIIKNLSVLRQFLEVTFKDLSSSVKNDLSSIEQIVSHSQITNPESALKLLPIKLKVQGLSQGVVPGFETNSKLLNSFKSSLILPGNTVLIAHLPKNELSTREEWIEAYKDSDLFLGVSKKNIKAQASIPFLTKEQLEELVTELDKVCMLCIQQEAFYQHLRQQKIRLRLVYKGYFESVLHRSKRAGLKDTLIDLVTIKNGFIDKVYLPAAIDIHDYSVRVINAYLKFIHKNAHVID